MARTVTCTTRRVNESARGKDLSGEDVDRYCQSETGTIQVADVDATHAKMLSDGVAFEHPPQKVYWGYGAELLDPSGYRLRLSGPGPGGRRRQVTS